MWLEEFTAVGEKFLANKDNASAIGGYEYKETTVNPEWGEVHVFERISTAQASEADMLLNNLQRGACYLQRLRSREVYPR